MASKDKTPVTIERCIITGAWIVSSIVAGHLQVSRYYGYTRKEAARFFKEEFNID